MLTFRQHTAVVQYLEEKEQQGLIDEVKTWVFFNEIWVWSTRKAMYDILLPAIRQMPGAAGSLPIEYPSPLTGEGIYRYRLEIQ